MITYEYYVSKCTLGNVCSMQILSTTQTSNNSNFIQFLEMLSTYVSFVHRLLSTLDEFTPLLLFHKVVYTRVQKSSKISAIIELQYKGTKK